MGTRMVLLDYIWPVESIGVGFIIIRPLPDDPKMAPWGTKYCMGIRDDGTTKWFQVHYIWVLWATFYLQTQKLFIQNAWLNCILKIVPWLCKILHDSSTLLYSVLHISKENMKEEKIWFVCFVTTVYNNTHTNLNFPLLKFSLEMCSTVCRKSRAPSTIQSTVCARPIEILAYVVKVCILNKKFLCLQVECCSRNPYGV